MRDWLPSLKRSFGHHHAYEVLKVNDTIAIIVRLLEQHIEVLLCESFLAVSHHRFLKLIDADAFTTLIRAEKLLVCLN